MNGVFKRLLNGKWKNHIYLWIILEKVLKLFIQRLLPTIPYNIASEFFCSSGKSLLTGVMGRTYNLGKWVYTHA